MLDKESQRHSGSRITPFLFGDVVILKETQFVSLMRSEVIFLPDVGHHDSLSFKLERKANGVYPYERSRSDWSMIRRVGEYEDLPRETKELLFPYRRGVVINGFHWDLGVSLLDKEGAQTIRSILQGNLEKVPLSVGLGTKTLIEKFFGSSYNKWRVLVHRSASWSTWEMIGSFGDEAKARCAFETSISESKRNPPKMLRHGVYENTGQINVVVLYQGFEERAYWSILVGQGEEEGEGALNR